MLSLLKSPPLHMRVPASLILSVYLLSSAAPALAQTADSHERSSDEAIDYVMNRGMLFLQSDGKFHPESSLTRVDLIRSIVRDVYTEDMRGNCFDAIAPAIPSRYTHLFDDVPRTHSSATEICVGMFTGLVEGREDGRFGADTSANLVEAAKVVSKAYGIAVAPGLHPEPGVPWHEPYWYSLAKRNAIPETVESRDAVLTRGEYAQILYRLRSERPTVGFRYQSVKARTADPNVTDTSQATITKNTSIPWSAKAPTATMPVTSEGIAMQMRVEERRLHRMFNGEMHGVSRDHLAPRATL